MCDSILQPPCRNGLHFVGIDYTTDPAGALVSIDALEIEDAASIFESWRPLGSDCSDLAVDLVVDGEVRDSFEVDLSLLPLFRLVATKGTCQ
jgi:hypothetical protein